MTNILGTRYVLAVQDVAKSTEFYRNKLSFKEVWNGDGWVFLKRDSCFIMLGECKEDISAFDTNNHSYFAYIDIEQVDLLYDELIQKDVEIISDIESKPWGQREFGIRTIDGHRIMFGEELK